MSIDQGRTLILIRHSLPLIVPDIPARQWVLAGEGRRRCEALADRLGRRPVGPDRVFTSDEPKARETGRLVAEALGLPWATAPDLHEHDRTGVRFSEDRPAFERQVAEFFARPGERIFGRETADQAHGRFEAAVRGLLTRHPEEHLAVVAHGTVISLLVSRSVGLEPFPFWRSLGMPAYVVLRLAGSGAGPELAAIVERGDWGDQEGPEAP